MLILYVNKAVSELLNGLSGIYLSLQKSSASGASYMDLYVLSRSYSDDKFFLSVLLQATYMYFPWNNFGLNCT